MAGKSNVSFFLSQQSIGVVEIDNRGLQKFFFIEQDLGSSSFKDPLLTDPSLINRFPSLIKTLKEKKIQSKEVGLTISSKDVVFRSFLIPWMNASEVKGAVEFEARKYLPFKISELTYSYYSFPVEDGGTKSLKIILAAIKNDLLDSYCQLCESLSLKVVRIEPASVSLIRYLISKKFLSSQKQVAIIQVDDLEGRIIVVDQGVPQLIRDFQRMPAQNQSELISQEALDARLFNEIRISLDYYSRQNVQGQVQEMLVVGPTTFAVNDLAVRLNKEFGLNVSPVNAQQLFNAPQHVSVDLLSAYGVGLRTTTPLKYAFEFLRKVNKPIKAIAPKAMVPVNQQSLVQLIVVCALFIFAAFWFSNSKFQQVQQKISSLTQQQGKHAFLSIEDIEKQTNEFNEKITTYKNVRADSHAAYFLGVIPQLLPEGTWLKELRLDYVDPAQESSLPNSSIALNSASQQVLSDKKTTIQVVLDGYAWAASTSQQLRLIKNIVENMKEHKELNQIFKQMELVSAQIQEVDQKTVTQFKIECR